MGSVYTEDSLEHQQMLFIKDKVEEYTAADSDNRNSVLSSMKHEDFDKLLEEYAEKMDIKLSSACDSYKPSMFEAKK